MAGVTIVDRLRLEVVNSEGKVMARVKTPQLAVRVVSALGDGAAIRDRKENVLWTQGVDSPDDCLTACNRALADKRVGRRPKGSAATLEFVPSPRARSYEDVSF